MPPRARRRWPLLAGAGVVAVTGTLALVALDRPASEAGRFTAEVQDTTPAAAPDPLRAELLRCRTLPPGADDPACRAAWDESRRQFFGEPRALRPGGAAVAAGSAPAEPGTKSRER